MPRSCAIPSARPGKPREEGRHPPAAGRYRALRRGRGAAAAPPLPARSSPLPAAPLRAAPGPLLSDAIVSQPLPPGSPFRAPFRLGNALRPEPSFPPLLAPTRAQQPLLPLETPAEGLAIAQRAAASALPAAPRCACGEKATGRPLRERGAVSARRAYKRGAAAGRRLPGAAPQVPGAAAGPWGGGRLWGGGFALRSSQNTEACGGCVWCRGGFMSSDAV